MCYAWASIAFEEPATGVYERICPFNSKWIRTEKRVYSILFGQAFVMEVTYCLSMLSSVQVTKRLQIKLLFASTETWSSYVHSIIYPLLSHSYFIQHCISCCHGKDLQQHDQSLLGVSFMIIISGMPVFFYVKLYGANIRLVFVSNSVRGFSVHFS